MSGNSINVSLEDWDDQDLIDELEDRGYYVRNYYNDDEPTEEEQLEEIWDQIFNLYQSYLLDEGEAFEMVIRKFFQDTINKTV